MKIKTSELKSEELSFWIAQHKAREGELNELRDIAQRMFVALATKHTDSYISQVLEDYQSYRKVYT